MSIRKFVCLLPLLFLPSIALAELPSATSLGTVEGAIDFCVQIDGRLATGTAEFKQDIQKGATAAELIQVHRSSEYSEAYDTIQNAFRKAPRAKIQASCVSALETGIPVRNHKR